MFITSPPVCVPGLSRTATSSPFDGTIADIHEENLLFADAVDSYEVAGAKSYQEMRNVRSIALRDFSQKSEEFYPESELLLSCGSRHVLLKTRQGKVYEWNIQTSTTGEVHFPSSKEEPILGIRAVGKSSFAWSAKSLWCWGDNKYGQLGVEEEFVSVPSKVNILEDKQILRLETSGIHTVCLTEDRTVFAWGSNLRGQLGHGTVSKRELPEEISFFKEFPVPVKTVAVTYWATVFLTEFGDVLVSGCTPSPPRVLSSPTDDFQVETMENVESTPGEWSATEQSTDDPFGSTAKPTALDVACELTSLFSGSSFVAGIGGRKTNEIWYVNFLTPELCTHVGSNGTPNLLVLPDAVIVPQYEGSNGIGC